MVNKRDKVQEQTRAKGEPVSWDSFKKRFLDDEERFDPANPMLIFGAVLVIFGILFASLNLFPFSWFGGDSTTDTVQSPTASSAETGANSSPQDNSEVADNLTESEGEEETSYVSPTISSIEVLSWDNDDGDHPDLAANLFDEDLETEWYSRYFTVNQFQDSTRIGLLVTLEGEANLSMVRINISGSGGQAEIRTNTSGSSRQGDVVTTFEFTDGETVVELPETLTTSEFAISFVTLPTDDEGYNRAKISEITVE